MSAGISGLIANTVELLVNAVSVFKVNGDGAIGVNDSYGEAGQVLKSAGDAASAEYCSAVNNSAAVTASGTAVDFTGIPSWVKKITIMFSEISTNGTSRVQFLLGTVGGIKVGSYKFVGSTNGANLTATSGFVTPGTSAADLKSGVYELKLLGDNIWMLLGAATADGTSNTTVVTGSKSLGDVLTQLRMTTVNGTDIFDAGTISISW